MRSSPQTAVIPDPRIHRHPQTPVLDRILSLFATPVYSGEGLSTLLLALNVFLLLATYYMLKTVRESLILASEVMSYSSAAQAMLLLGIVPAYGWFASGVDRVRLVVGITLFFISHLAVFLMLGRSGLPIDIPFYLWLGIFKVMVIAQFWAFAADIYSSDNQGRRLLPVVGIGSSIGALAGASASSVAFSFFGPFDVVAIAMLLPLCAGFPVLVNRHHCAARVPKTYSRPASRKRGCLSAGHEGPLPHSCSIARAAAQHRKHRMRVCLGENGDRRGKPPSGGAGRSNTVPPGVHR